MDIIIWNAMLLQFRIQFLGTEGGVYSCVKKVPNVPNVAIRVDH